MVEVPQAAILVVEVTVPAVAEDLEVVEAGEKVRKVPNVRKISNLLLISTTYQIFFSKFYLLLI
jgi:precorrin-4 methylase